MFPQMIGYFLYNLGIIRIIIPQILTGHLALPNQVKDLIYVNTLLMILLILTLYIKGLNIWESNIFNICDFGFRK